MGRGQYDRAAARQKREDGAAVMAYDVGADLVIPLTQEKFDAIMAGMIRLRDERDRLLRLCQTHGLMIDG